MFAPHHPGKGELLGRHQHRGRVLSRQGWAGPGGREARSQGSLSFWVKWLQGPHPLWGRPRPPEETTQAACDEMECDA